MSPRSATPASGSAATESSAPDETTRRAAWRMIAGLGAVSLAADLVYESARSVTGPLLASLGATATLVGLVSGVGEATALVFRLASGSWADRSGRYWGWAFAGYAMTAVSVPALALTPFLGGAGLAVGCALIIMERLGKAVRSPAKTVLLARVSAVVGLGRGFGVHKALDQLGAMAGPLLVAGVIALTGAIWAGLAVLAVPGAVALIIMILLWRRGAATDEPTAAGHGAATRAEPQAEPTRLPVVFWIFATASALATAGLVTFAVIGYHLVADRVTTAAAVPVVYAAAMAAAGAAALATGWLYDRFRFKVLLVLPALIVVVPLTAFTRSVPLVMVGVLTWGAANGLQDSVIKAFVAELVPARRRGTAYGWFAAVQGAAAVLGGLAAGALYQHSIPSLVAYVAGSQVLSLVLLILTLRRGVTPSGP